MTRKCTSQLTANQNAETGDFVEQLDVDTGQRDHSDIDLS